MHFTGVYNHIWDLVCQFCNHKSTVTKDSVNLETLKCIKCKKSSQTLEMGKGN